MSKRFPASFPAGRAGRDAEMKGRNLIEDVGNGLSQRGGVYLAYG